MQLRPDTLGVNQLLLIIKKHYQKQRRVVHAHLPAANMEKEEKSVEFLIDRKHVARYSISPGDQCGTFLGNVYLGIGPRFFTPFEFWSVSDGERFRLSTDPFDIEVNLDLLDEFLGSHEK